MVSQCRVIIEREIETPAAFSNVMLPKWPLRQLGIFSQKCINSLKGFPEYEKGVRQTNKVTTRPHENQKERDTFALAYEKFCPSPKTKELEQNIQSSELRIELELHTRDLVDQKLLANNANTTSIKIIYYQYY